MDLLRLPLPSLLMPNLAWSARGSIPASSLKGPRPASLVLSCPPRVLGHPCPQNRRYPSSRAQFPAPGSLIAYHYHPPKPSSPYFIHTKPLFLGPPYSSTSQPLNSTPYPVPPPEEDPQLAHKERNPS